MNASTTKQLTIHIDLSGLDGFLCLEPTLMLIDDLDVTVRWLPIAGVLGRVSGRAPVSTMDASDPLAQYKARRAKARQAFEKREHARNCYRLGITAVQGYRAFDATLAHIGLLYVNQLKIDPRDYIAGAYRAGFAQEENLDTLEALVELLQVTGIATRELEHYLDAGKAQFRALQENLLEQSIFGSPAYLYQGQRYHGRQHLPLLRWYLEGSQGNPPV
jgi:2-hydroxychromene-2-carboxylate isomerase